MRPSALFLVVAAILVSAGCSRAITPEQVCAVKRSHFNIPSLDGPEAWDWPAEARRVVASHRWIEVSQAQIDRCPRTASRVVGLAFSPGGAHAQVTISTYPGAPIPDVTPSEYGSIVTCLLRRRRVGEVEQWKRIACKLDAVS